MAKTKKLYAMAQVFLERIQISFLPHVFSFRWKHSPVPSSHFCEYSHRYILHHLGIFQQTAYYFHYCPKEATLLDEDYLATITEKAESYVIYADRCLLSEEFMARHHIVFKKIPRDIAVL